MSDGGSRWRLLGVAGIVVLAMAGLGARLAFLHLGPHGELLNSLEKNQKVEKTLLAGRGVVYDCSGGNNILALNLTLKDVCVDPSFIVRSNQVDRVTKELATLLGVDAGEVASRFQKEDRRFAYIERFVPEEKAAKILSMKLPGVFLIDEPIRHYPNHAMACHILGFVNNEGVGSAGIEQTFDSYMRGTPGKLETKVNALRQEIYWKRDQFMPPVSGANIHLTLDQNVQYIVEKCLDEVMEEHNAKAAWAIVQRVHTGEILAMASRPGYDLNAFGKADKSQMLNRAIGSVYEPGSTFKSVAISAAFNEGLVTPETIFDCENGAWMYEKRVLRDFHPYGRLTVADGLKKSSNILTAKVSLLLGESRFYKYLKAYGLGNQLGIDLPGEEVGILHPVSKWSGISITRLPIGQGIAVTALQMLGVYCTIANDGFLMKPYVVGSVQSSDGKYLYQAKPEVISRPISTETAMTMRRLLERVTEEGGTGLRARVEGYEVAGKTGSAQKPERGGYSSSAYMASFVGFLPAEDPEIGLIVVVDEPQPFHTGGVVAGPAFSKIATQTVRYLEIPPDPYRVANRIR